MAEKKTNGVAVAVLVVLGFALVGAFISKVDTPRVQTAAATPPAPQSCGVESITIGTIDAGFVDECRGQPCPSLKGVGTLTNGCPTPLGVRLKVTALDANGKPVATRELWPASVRNIPPGDYTFDMNGWLDYDPRMTNVRVEAIETKAW